MDSTIRETQEHAEAALSDKDDQLNDLSRALAVLASASVRMFWCYLFYNGAF